MDINLEEVIDDLLMEEKTIRDPVQGDITTNRLETAVIDTEIFQRLRRIRQLGTVHLVFPGAEHSRFQHSLGTLHVAHILLENISRNSPEYGTFGKKPLQGRAFRLVVRLSALLHDLYEFPLSHTLEKEGHIFEKQWKDTSLNLKIFGEESELFSAISDCISDDLNITRHVQTTLSEKEPHTFCRNLAATILVFVYKILIETEEGTTDIAKTLFKNEKVTLDFLDEDYLDAGGYIIRNTICADLLDYLARDFYFCGIDKKYDKRFLVYSTFVNLAKSGKKKKIAFAYSLTDKRNRIKQSVLSSLFDVLELRYSLAEMVHTHRVKNAYSAMVIEAFDSYYQSLAEEVRDNFKKEMMNMGDDELLAYLRKKNLTAKYILDSYFKRRHYKEVVLWENWESVINSPNLAEGGLKELRSGESRYLLERTLVKWINARLPEAKKLRDGDLLLYVMPNPKDLWKELGTNVVYIGEDGKPSVSTLEKLSLQDILTPMSPMMRVVVRRIGAQKDLLMQKYSILWRISLFISPNIELNDPDYSRIPSECSELIEKIFSFQGLDMRPMTKRPVVMPDKISRILVKIEADRRSYWTMKELFNFPIDELTENE